MRVLKREHKLFQNGEKPQEKLFRGRLNMDIFNDHLCPKKLFARIKVNKACPEAKH